MAIDGSEVRVAGAGHVYVAPKGTALPTDLTDLDAKYVDLGYVTEDGVSFSFGREVEDLNAWQGDKIRTLSTKEPATTSFSLMQTNATIMTVAFGGGEVTESGTDPNKVYTFTPPKSGTNTERVLVIEFEDGADVKYRYIIPRAQIEGNVDFTLTRSGALTYPLTLGILDNGDAAKFTIVSNDAHMAPGAQKFKGAAAVGDHK
jgi:hypothetical protein